MRDLSDYPEDEILDYASYILDMRLREPGRALTDPQTTRSYLRMHFNGMEHEAFGVFFLDNQHRVIEFDGNMFRGTVATATVHPREVVKSSLAFNAAAVILTHNHPSGVCEPSQSDRRITERLQSALNLVDIRVLDHLVVGDTEIYSFAEHGLI